MSQQAPPPPRGRRIALPPPERVARTLKARLDVTFVLAVLLPVLTIGALSLVHAPRAVDTREAPTSSGLNLVTLTCPSALSRSGGLSVASGTGASGSVEVDQSGEDAASARTTTVQVTGEATSTADPGRKPLTVRGLDDLAPGLLAARSDQGPAAVDCRVPSPDQWFTGLGAAARHSSVLELVNPDPGSADADITLIGARGPLDAPQLRGITVPGGRSLRIDLSREVPQRGELSAHVVVTRGRLGVFAADSFDQLGHGAVGTDWLAPQEPATTSTLLGLPTGSGTRSLVLANDGADEARVTVRVVTKDSAFRPEGLDEVRVPPGSVARVPLSAILGRAVKDGAVGVQVEATHPVTATLRSFLDGDISHSVPVTGLGATTVEIVPGGTARVLLTATTVGSAKVRAVTASGQQRTVDVDLAPGRTVTVELPKASTLVTVTPSRDGVSGALVVQGQGKLGGAVVLPLRDLVLTSLVPAVRPALP